ncbi:MAG: tRNA pseudouridine(55) synthase TruB [Gemmatimonadetes bacterium]|nr:MAG: tRNA pseudouridine(55) synthase TruB [Gemmatimonadota bacterium]
MLLRALPVRTTATDGLLLVDKGPGVTSHDVVALARRSLRTRRVGHTGTLDPFATGLLVLLVGRATRLARYVDDEPKVYDATISFGAETSTDDPTGEVTRIAAPPSAKDVDEAIDSLTGSILQRPPDYSAKKVAGKRAYTAARAGTPLTLTPVSVVVHEWIVRRRTLTTMDVTIACGGGTYVRALARDLGRATGSAAHLTALRRTRCGVFDVAEGLSLADLDGENLTLAPLRSAIPHFPTQSVAADDLRRVLHGNAVEARVDAPLVALVDADGDLVAVAQREGATLQPRAVIRDA